MASFFRREDPDILNAYGYTFRATKLHMTGDQLDPLKHKYDVMGSEALAVIDSLHPPPPPRAGWYAKTKEEDPQPDRDTYAVLRDNCDKDPKLQALWNQINTVPEWVDWEQIKRGQEVFYRYAPAAVAGFAFQALLATTGAAIRAAETLVRTGGHSARVGRIRLFETFQLILQVCRSLEDVKPGGEAFASAVRVRFLHASVRNRILKLNDQRPGYYDVKQYGVPINELDGMQSVCAFSTNLVWLGIPGLGIHVRQQEALDYCALWRWVTYVMGMPYYVLETPERARATMETILYNTLIPSKNSRVLAKNLVAAMDGVAPVYEPKDFWEAGSRYVNGNQICDDIGLGKPTLYWDAVVRGICWSLMVVSYTTRSIPSWDRWMVKTFRKLLWDYIVEHKDGLKGGYKYEFKYVPQIGSQTSEVDKVAPPPLRRATPPLEKLGLGAFIMAMVLSAVAISLAGKIALQAFKAAF